MKVTYNITACNRGVTDPQWRLVSEYIYPVTRSDTIHWCAHLARTKRVSKLTADALCSGSVTIPVQQTI